jgi:hypothetical protein
MKAIAIVYRDNSLYTVLVPLMEKILTMFGFSVEIQCFPKGTDVGVIKDWINSHEASFKDKLICSDDTCWGSNRCPSPNIYLDYISDIIMLSIFGESRNDGKLDPWTHSPNSWNFSFEGFKSQFIKLLTKSFSIFKPEKIYIVTHEIMCHEPFNKYGSLEYKEMTGVMDRVSLSEYASLSRDEQSECCARIVKDIIQESGFSPEDVIVLSLIDFREQLKQIDIREAWVITDRHANIPILASAIHLRLPLSNFIQDANNNNLSSYTEEELGNAVESVLKEDLIEKNI